MYPLNLRRSLTPLAAVAFLTTAAEAVESYTNAAGYVQITIPGSSLGTVSATLQNKSNHTSNATINADFTGTAQTLTVAGAGWTAGQWASEGYLAYVSDASNGEEAFLITGNTSDTITIQTDFDLLDVDRDIPAVTSISIRLAQTLGGLFGFGAETDFTSVDRVFLWTGGSWATYYHASGNWRKIGGNLFETFNDELVYPDEAFFIQRNDTNSITFTFFGDVPSKAQVTTMAGPGLQMVSTRYPVETSIGQLGFETLPNWQQGSGGDLVYLWDGGSWLTYYYAGGAWRKVGGNLFETFDNDPVPPDSGVFVSRKGISGPAESANFHVLPYTP